MNDNNKLDKVDWTKEAETYLIEAVDRGTVLYMEEGEGPKIKGKAIREHTLDEMYLGGLIDIEDYGSGYISYLVTNYGKAYFEQYLNN